MTTVIGAIILGIAMLLAVWYTIRTNGKSQSIVEASQAAKEAADKRVKELEALRSETARKEKEEDESEASKVTDAAGAAEFLRESFTRHDTN